jgi:AcrR family transcriptional regulator
VVPPSYRDYRLPRGRHGLGGREVLENQRWRLIGAGAEILAEARLEGVTSRAVARRAGVSGETFYRHFADVPDLLVAAFAVAAQLLVEVVGRACVEGCDGAGAAAAALEAALVFGAAEPGLGALMRTEVAVALPQLAAERERLLGRLAALAVGEGRGPTSRAGLAAVGALLSIGLDLLEAGEPTGSETAGELAGLLMSAAADSDRG